MDPSRPPLRPKSQSSSSREGGGQTEPKDEKEDRRRMEGVVDDLTGRGLSRGEDSERGVQGELMELLTGDEGRQEQTN
jgi:hypothetical protein